MTYCIIITTRAHIYYVRIFSLVVTGRVHATYLYLILRDIVYWPVTRDGTHSSVVAHIVIVIYALPVIQSVSESDVRNDLLS